MFFQSLDCSLHFFNWVTDKAWVLRLHLLLPTMVPRLIKELLTFCFYLPWQLPTSSIDLFIYEHYFLFFLCIFSMDSVREIASIFIIFSSYVYCKSYPINEISWHIHYNIFCILLEYLDSYDQIRRPNIF